jgi:hypothetical protein
MKSGRGGLLGVATVLLLGAVATSAQAQEAPQGTRIWIGPSLGNRDNEIARQTLSAIGFSKDLSREKNESLQVYVDAFRVINRPAEVVARKVTDEVIGAGFARVYSVKDKAGVGAYYGFGLGFYRNRQSDTFLGGGTATSQSAGGKLLVGTSLDGPFFLQLQLTYMNTRTDFQLGIGQRF